MLIVTSYDKVFCRHLESKSRLFGDLHCFRRCRLLSCPCFQIQLGSPTLKNYLYEPDKNCIAQIILKVQEFLGLVTVYITTTY